MGFSTTDRCRKCDEPGETAEHLLCECEAFAYNRYKYFGKDKMEPEDFASISLKEIIEFINKMKFLENNN